MPDRRPAFAGINDLRAAALNNPRGFPASKSGSVSAEFVFNILQEDFLCGIA